MRRVPLVLALLALGCGTGELVGAPAVGSDGSGAVDARVERDSGAGDSAVVEDAATRDAAAEAGRSDAGASDMSGPDVGVEPDMGAEPDTGAEPDLGVEPDMGPTGVVTGCADDAAIDADDRELFQLINDYRVSRGLDAVPFSCSLSRVARLHVADLIDQAPHTSGSCNLHSWSDAGDWSGCCYTPDHAQAACMWNKPGEITEYGGNGYEISAGGYGSPAAALAGWQGSPGHHNVIINADIWNRPWRAMGVAITPGRFAHVWFGHQDDPHD
ncbi:MAG: CAP domain-containing protein [Myxococcota bacterium]